MRSRPVARGSRVPQWPTFLVLSRRRTIATTSCDVMPGALSTSRTPSRLVKFMIDRLQNSFLDFGERAADARPGCESVSAAAEQPADLAHIDLRRLRAQAHAHASVSNLLEERRGDDPVDGADVIDEPLGIVRLHAQIFRGFRVQGK